MTLTNLFASYETSSSKLQIDEVLIGLNKPPSFSLHHFEHIPSYLDTK